MAGESIYYQAVIDGDEQTTAEIRGTDLSEADIVRVSDSVLHLLQGQSSYTLQVLHADYAAKTFVLKIGGKQVHVKLRDAVEARVHAMGFDINRNHVKLKQIVSPMPGLVLKVLATAGDRVTEGQPVLVLEAMKMENVLNAPIDGTIKEILVAAGKNVDKGQVLVTLDD